MGWRSGACGPCLRPLFDAAAQGCEALLHLHRRSVARRSIATCSVKAVAHTHSMKMRRSCVFSTSSSLMMPCRAMSTTASWLAPSRRRSGGLRRRAAATDGHHPTPRQAVAAVSAVPPPAPTPPTPKPPQPLPAKVAAAVDQQLVAASRAVMAAKTAPPLSASAAHNASESATTRGRRKSSRSRGNRLNSRRSGHHPATTTKTAPPKTPATRAEAEAAIEAAVEAILLRSSSGAEAGDDASAATKVAASATASVAATPTAKAMVEPTTERAKAAASTKPRSSRSTSKDPPAAAAPTSAPEAARQEAKKVILEHIHTRRTTPTAVIKEAASCLSKSARSRIQAQIQRKRIMLQRQRAALIEKQQQQKREAAAAGASAKKAAAAATQAARTPRVDASAPTKTQPLASTATSATTTTTTTTKSSSAAATKKEAAASGVVEGGGAKRGANPMISPDHRERVLQIFEMLSQINSALGERFKSASYYSAMERLKRGDLFLKVLPPNMIDLSPEKEAALRKHAKVNGMEAELESYLSRRKLVETSDIPGVGTKLKKKICEILKTGDLAELHELESKPVVRAIRELTQVHGFGPRTAIHYYKEFGISSVAELRQYAKEHDAAAATSSTAGTDATRKAAKKKKKDFHLTDAQREGLKYYHDIQQRIPHAEGRVHEAYLKQRLRKALGRDYELTVCGSFRRQVPTSGDIDVLLTNSAAATGKPLPAPEVLSAFVDALRKDGYIVATLAQGPTKFMGVSRLHNPNSASTKKFCARRLDIRYVDASSYPAALLYFTGSKEFNVTMRAEAIAKHFILNEYGLFRTPAEDKGARSGNARLHDMISKMAKAQYGGHAADERGEVAEMAKELNRLRVKVSSEKDIFASLGMLYVQPQDRNL